VRLALALVVAAALTALAPAAAATVHLRIVDRAPLTLRGLAFVAGERVVVKVELGDRTAGRLVRADASGRFLVRFPGVVYDRCHGALTVEATGSRGTRAGFTLQPLDCPN
jgi:hypothetical protein